MLLEKMHKMNTVGACAGGEGFEETRPKHGMSVTFSEPPRGGSGAVKRHDHPAPMCSCMCVCVSCVCAHVYVCLCMYV